MNKKVWVPGVVLLLTVAMIFGTREAKKAAVMNGSSSDDKRLVAQRILSAEKELAYVGDVRSPASPAQLQRKIIRNADVGLVVKHYEPFFNALEKEVNEVGAYISQIQVNRSSGNVSSAYIVLRLPPQKLLVSVSWIREQGIITSEKVTAEDISEQYYDLQARFSNARKFEARLLEMLQTRTGNLTDVVQVEEKLNQVREQIEQMERKLHYYDNLMDLATLTLNVSVQKTYIPPHPPSFVDRISGVWHGSVASLKESAQFLVLFVVGVIPWILPAGMVFILFWYFVKRLRKLKFITKEG